MSCHPAILPRVTVLCSMLLAALLANHRVSAQEAPRLFDFFSRATDAKSAKEAQAHFDKAQQLEAAGDQDKAATEYLNALRKSPQTVGSQGYRVVRFFQRADRVDELMAVLSKTDLSRFGQYNAVSNMYRYLMDDQKHREAGFQLFHQAWEAFPKQRLDLLGTVYREDVWQSPKMFAYAHQVLITEDTAIDNNPWAGMQRIMSYGGEGVANGVGTRIIAAARQHDKTQSLSKEILEKLERKPRWLGGQALLAALDAREGHGKQAADRVHTLLASPAAPMPLQTRWMLSQEFEGIDELQTLAVELLEGVRPELLASNNGFGFSAARRLVEMYARQGRRQDARKLVRDFMEGKDYSVYGRGNPGYGEYQELQNIIGAGPVLVKIGFPLDAVRMYKAAMNDADKIEKAKRWYGGSDYLTRQLQEGLRQAEAAVTPDALATALHDWIKPDAKQAGEAVGLMLSVEPRAVSDATIRSEFQAALEATAESAAGKDAVAKVGQDIRGLLSEHQDDVSLLVSSFLVSQTVKNKEHRLLALKRLAEFVAAHPLVKIEMGKQPTKQQRSEAVHRLPIWVVAREALQDDDEDVRKLGEALADHALAAAERQTDASWALALLREWGHVELTRGNKQEAEEKWSNMLDLIFNT